MTEIENIGYNDAQPIREGQQRIVIGELLLAMKHAIEKMSVRNSHRGVMTTAGSLIIHLVTENQQLRHEIELWKAEPPSLELPPPVKLAIID